MKELQLATFVALLMVGCGEETSDHEAATPHEDDPSVPAAIPCMACGEKVSKKTTECRQCGHPTPDSIVAYKEAQERARRLAEAERKRQEERAEEERQRLAAKKAEREKQLALDKEREKQLAPDKATLKKTGEKPFTVPGLSLEMLWCAPGTFEMGSSFGSSDETPHTVTLTEGYWLGTSEVTQAQWQKVMGSNPSRFKGADRPVERVSWTDVTAFCDELTELERRAERLPAGLAYQLPTEAQWEYACRAGTRTAFSFGASLTTGQANVSGGSEETTDVGKYPANAWGFHDMHGNVWEWCADWYGDYPRLEWDRALPARDPVGPAVGSNRVKRGGSWNFTAFNARSPDRNWSAPAIRYFNLGFRLSLRPASKYAE